VEKFIMAQLLLQYTANKIDQLKKVVRQENQETMRQ